MLITSKGRYALRLMIYIAAFGGNGDAECAVTADGSPATKISLREVAERERISLKYLEQLVRPLMAAGLLKSVRGKGGGYVLARPSSEILAGDILRAAEGEKSAVACDGLDGACGRSDLCSTVKFWTGLERAIDDYVDSVTLAELATIPDFSLSIHPNA
ncbi:MAG: Rrf2 family transcriptional regulator [Coriobacteriaceae bacterium]|nr:Rrf2 family transcriptional regulator [Coriobacteriaceae bacterium]